MRSSWCGEFVGVRESEPSFDARPSRPAAHLFEIRNCASALRSQRSGRGEGQRMRHFLFQQKPGVAVAVPR
ncbi:hypothetical protein EVAR_91143_1 [Eumeta japonica]|uniref:Uncharacterized protein n=1 Tax=Eumeta variegata TaxID=151549 RepID=A0A4C2A636_EUMVA|nr:hypothetical protein EVAR_91143_1 [Eumeta japonica]